MPRVAMPLYPGVTLMDFAGATQIFTMAGYQVLWVADTEKRVLTSEQVTVNTNANYTHDMSELEILFVPGGFSTGPAMQDEPLLDYLRNASKHAIWTGSVCTGVFLLVAAGIIRDLEATTHWAQLDNLRLLTDKYGVSVAPGYPRGVINHERKLFTGGGISSSVDLALEFVAAHFGKQHAERSQLINQYAPTPPTNAGDPATASRELVERLRGGPFVDNMRAAVERLLC